MSVDSAFWRRLAYAGARYGPRFWVRYSPPLFGLAFAAALPRERTAVRRNLRRVRGLRSPVAERLDVARTFVDYASCLAESLAAGRPEAQRATVDVVGRDHLEAALGRGRGMVLVTAHTGAWDAAAGLLGAHYAAETLMVMAGERDVTARALHDGARKRSGVRVAHVGSHPLDVLPLLRHVKRGGVVAVQLDRVLPGAPTVAVELFAERSALPRGPFALAAATGAPLLPLFIRRRGFFRYEARAWPPVDVPRRPSEEELRRVAGRAAAAMEAFIRANPTQWFQFTSGDEESGHSL